MSAQKNKTPDPEGMSLEALQSRSERLGDWIGENPTPILGTLGAVLVIALVVGLIGSTQESTATEAADALAAARRDYRVGMGAEATSVEISEPANPEAARAAREAAITDFSAVIDEFEDTPAAGLAALDMGEILVDLDRVDEAITAWETAAGRADGALQGLLLQRIAAEAEEQERFEQAASAYQRASQIEGYPLRFQALAESARLSAATGDNDAAIALLQQLEADAPDYQLPEHIASRLQELRAGQSD